MKRIIANVRIHNANTENGITKVFNSGIDESGVDALMKAVKYFTDCGVSVKNAETDSKNTTGLSVIIDNRMGHGLRTISLSEISMHPDVLIQLHDTLENLGMVGIEITRAIADAYQLLSSKDYDTITWISPHKASKMIKFLLDYIDRIFEARMMKGDIKSLFTTIGGYAGFKALMYDALHVTASYIDTGTAPDFMDAYKNKCITCKHCEWDIKSRRFCKKCAISISGNLTANEICQIYPEVEIIDGKMYSNFTPFGVESCEHYSRRH